VSSPALEAWLAGGYAVFLLACALCTDWLSAHTHRRSLRYRTAGFTYDAQHDHWQCPEGQHLWPHEFDNDRRLVRYRAKAHICNGCARKHACTDSDRGREVVRPLDPWPHSEAGRFHRGVCLVLVALAALVLLVAAARNHQAGDLALLAPLFLVVALTARWLVADFRRHPSGFPDAAPSHGLKLTVAAGDGSRPHSRWRSQDREGVSP
jgi:hypothetical protein